LFFGLVFAGGHLNQEVRDYEADRCNGIRTTAVVFGRRRAFVASLVIFTAAYALLILLVTRAMLAPLLIWAGLLWPWHLYCSLRTLRGDVGCDAAIWMQRRYRLQFALLGLVMAFTTPPVMELARHAQKIGADGILAITPYFWTPSLPAIEAYFVRLCSAIELPVLSYNSPSYLAGVEITGALMSRLIERLPNFAGVKEASFNSEKFLEISRAALSSRPDFALLTGVEYLLPSIPLGGVGSYSAAGSICPNLCSQLYDACVQGDWPRARELQYKVPWLWLLFRDQYPSSLKGGMVMMGRPVGPTRPPLPTASKQRQSHIRSELERLGIFDSEPHGR
jgi:4-hydroxy-tetrahydrodipicolinate synthase